MLWFLSTNFVCAHWRELTPFFNVYSGLGSCNSFHLASLKSLLSKMSDAVNILGGLSTHTLTSYEVLSALKHVLSHLSYKFQNIFRIIPSPHNFACYRVFLFWFVPLKAWKLSTVRPVSLCVKNVLCKATLRSFMQWLVNYLFDTIPYLGSSSWPKGWWAAFTVVPGG